MGLVNLWGMRTEECPRISHLRGRKVIKNKFTSRITLDAV